jgi:hypothetical protein
VSPLQVNRHFLRQWEIAGIKTLDLIDGRARVLRKIENIDLTPDRMIRIQIAV